MSQTIILGIDEVGRGPWAGPLVVGAVILGPEFSPENIAKLQDISAKSNNSQENIVKDTENLQDLSPEDTEKLELYENLADSKQLTTKKREALEPLILKYATTHGLGWVSAAEIDKYGLSASLKLATRRAVKQVLATKTVFTEIILDGTVNFLQNTPLESRVALLKKADALIKEVSAASIIAKVARDRYMAEIATQHPAYGFEKHVGYGTALHKKALLEHGICPEHRTSFRPIREIIAQTKPESPIFNQDQSTSRNFSINSNLTSQNQPISTKNRQNSPPAGSASNHFSTPPSTSTKGQTAENVVARHLQAQNHIIIAKNFKTKTYEIDLISTLDKQIFFTEVKYSQNLAQEGTALVRITPEKQRQMYYAAQAFLANHPNFADFQPFLAVASVSGTEYHVDDWFILE